MIQLTFAYGALPWIAFGLAASFGSYGLAKKKAPLDPLEGLTLETAILCPLALVYLAILHQTGDGVFLRTGATTDALMIGGGLVTTVPLLLFASAVRSVPLSVIGILQYIGPTIQFILGVFVYDEPFSRMQLIGFSIVWVALAIYAGDSLRARRVSQQMPRAGRRHGLTRAAADDSGDQAGAAGRGSCRRGDADRGRAVGGRAR